MFKKYNFRDYRFRLVIYVVLLSIIGVFVIGSAKKSVQSTQELGLIAGVIVMVIVSLIDYNFILKFNWLIYIFTLGILMAVKLFGDDAGGATRWIDLKVIRFQPSELAKILLILFFAFWLAKNEEQINSPKMILLTIILAAMPLGLIVTQPDLSTTIITAAIIAGMFFVAGLSYKIVGTVLAIGIPGCIILISMILQGKLGDSYQFIRILAWLQPEKYPSKALQQQNSIMAIGSGQLWGKGLNNNVVASVKNGNFILEPETDFIYAVAGEELGFIGSVIIIILLACIVFECIMIARKAQDSQGKYIAIGMATLIGIQAFVNIGVTTGLLPNTGVTLPFVSYGLTSLLSLYVGIGLVLNVGLQPKRYKTGVYK